jgi:hypothetical protein
VSTLVFDGTAHTLTFFDTQGNQVGQWPANNLVDHGYVVNHHGLPFIPNDSYTIEDQDAPHTHGRNNPDDSLNGAYGRFGIIRLDPFSVNGRRHAGVAVHSGRADAGAENHATHGCIRTTDEAMGVITRLMRNDPLESITVQNNHDQHHRPRHRRHTQPGGTTTQPSTSSGAFPMI